jgi:choice-of-anchor C domain-containing protein
MPIRVPLATATAVLLLAVHLPFGQKVGAEDKKAYEKEEENLIVNGSFEEGPDVDVFLPLDKGSTDLKGWTVTRGQIDFIGNHWTSGDGKRRVDLHGSPGFGGVQQTFKTTEGNRYRVTFLMAGSPGGLKTEYALSVRAANNEQKFYVDTAGATREEMGWVKKTWEFVAVADDTTLEIHTYDGKEEDPSGVAGPALDDVRVVAVASKK